MQLCMQAGRQAARALTRVRLEHHRERLRGSRAGKEGSVERRLPGELNLAAAFAAALAAPMPEGAGDEEDGIPEGDAGAVFAELLAVLQPHVGALGDEQCAHVRCARVRRGPVGCAADRHAETPPTTAPAVGGARGSRRQADPPLRMGVRPPRARRVHRALAAAEERLRVLQRAVPMTAAGA